MSNKLVFLSVIFLGVFAIFGCSVKDNLDDMHDKTSQMAATTQTMAGETKELKGLGSSTYLDMRKANSFDARNKARAELNSHPALSDKLGYAKTLFYAFEFQLYKNEGLDNAEKLAKMKDDAVEEFFQFLTVEWGPSEHFWQSFTPLKQRTLNLYAYAATIHEIDPDQIIQAKRRGFEPQSLLSIIEEALLEEYKNPGQDPNLLPKWMYYDQLFKRNALDLMQLRVTFMPLLAYAFLNHVETMSSVELIWKSVANAPVNVYPAEETTARLDFIGLIVRRALMTRHFLNQIGRDAVPEDSLYDNLSIHKTLKNMIVHSNQTDTVEASNYKANQLTQFSNWVELLYSSRETFNSVASENYNIPN